MSQNQVTVVPDDNGNVIRQSQNSPEYGFVRVTQDSVQYGNNGWVQRKTRSSLILGKLEDLKEIDVMIEEVTEKTKVFDSHEEAELYLINDGIYPHGGVFPFNIRIQRVQ